MQRHSNCQSKHRVFIPSQKCDTQHFIVSQLHRLQNTSCFQRCQRTSLTRTHTHLRIDERPENNTASLPLDWPSTPRSPSVSILDAFLNLPTAALYLITTSLLEVPPVTSVPSSFPLLQNLTVLPWPAPHSPSFPYPLKETSDVQHHLYGTVIPIQDPSCHCTSSVTVSMLHWGRSWEPRPQRGDKGPSGLPCPLHTRSVPLNCLRSFLCQMGLPPSQGCCEDQLWLFV